MTEGRCRLHRCTLPQSLRMPCTTWVFLHTLLASPSCISAHSSPTPDSTRNVRLWRDLRSCSRAGVGHSSKVRLGASYHSQLFSYQGCARHCGNTDPNPRHQKHCWIQDFFLTQREQVLAHSGLRGLEGSGWEMSPSVPGNLGTWGLSLPGRSHLGGWPKRTTVVLGLSAWVWLQGAGWGRVDVG